MHWIVIEHLPLSLKDTENNNKHRGIWHFGSIPVGLTHYAARAANPGDRVIATVELKVIVPETTSIKGDLYPLRRVHRTHPCSRRVSAVKLVIKSCGNNVVDTLQRATFAYEFRASSCSAGIGNDATVQSTVVGGWIVVCR